jgi:hypothetical protein
MSARSIAPPARVKISARRSTQRAGSATLIQSGVKPPWVKRASRPGWISAIEKLEADAGGAALVPAGQAAAKLARALVKLDLALAAQHVVKPVFGDQLLQRRGRMGHQRGLRGHGGAVAAGQARLPERQQPGRDAQRIGRRDRQRPVRIEQPARRPSYDAGRGQRDDVGEGEGAGIAARGAGGDALAVEHRDLVPAPDQRQRRRHADHAGTDHADPHPTLPRRPSRNYN